MVPNNPGSQPVSQRQIGQCKDAVTSFCDLQVSVTAICAAFVFHSGGQGAGPGLYLEFLTSTGVGTQH
jgi:hypothetical protein